MAGVELVGLLFGALGLIDPISKGLKSVSGMTKSSASFQKYMVQTSLQSQCYGEMFKNESRRLFGRLLSETQIDSMFGDKGEDDPIWQNLQWKEDVRNHLGRFYIEISSSMLLVFQTLSTLAKNLDKLALEDFNMVIEASNALKSKSKQKSISMKEKTRVEHRKGKIKEKFQDVNRYVLLYKDAINHFLEDQKWRLNATKALMKSGKRQSPCMQGGKAPPWVSIAPAIDNVHEATQELSLALQRAASCPCHSFHLRLEMALTNSRDTSSVSTSIDSLNGRDPGYQALTFNILSVSCPAGNSTGSDSSDVILDGEGNPISQLFSLRVELKPISTPKRVSTLSTTELSIQNPTPITELSPRNPPSVIQTGGRTKSALKKTVAFGHNIGLSVASMAAPNKGKRKNSENHQDPRAPVYPEPAEDLTMDCATMLHEIDDLCAWLQKLGSPSTSTAGDCLGYICHDKAAQYLLYPEKTLGMEMDENRVQNYESLLDLLSSGRLVLSILQRLELAHTLAISLLRLHSSSWIRQNWSAKDVMLFLSTTENQSQHQMSPYVAAAFNDMDHMQQIANSENQSGSTYKLSYVVSLGIILLEIGLSRCLNVEEDDIMATSKDLETWIRACKEVALASVNEKMGPRYHRVVQTCVKWMDEDSLSDEEVQRKFYEQVVVQLEVLLQKASASATRRNRRRVASDSGQLSP